MYALIYTYKHEKFDISDFSIPAVSEDKDKLIKMMQEETKDIKERFCKNYHYTNDDVEVDITETSVDVYQSRHFDYHRMSWEIIEVEQVL